MCSGIFLKTSLAEGEVVEVDPNRVMTCNTTWNFPLKKRSRGKRPNSKFRDGKVATPVKAQEPNQTMPSNNVAAAREPDRFDCNKGFFSINRACGQCQGTGQIIADPAPLAAGKNGYTGNEP